MGITNGLTCLNPQPEVGKASSEFTVSASLGISKLLPEEIFDPRQGHEKAFLEYGRWQKEQERAAIFGTTKSLTEAKSQVRKYYEGIEKESQESTH